MQLLIIFNFALSADIDLECSFASSQAPFTPSTDYLFADPFYTCTVVTTPILPRSNVATFSGTHVGPSGDVDVRLLRVEGTSFFALPTNIESKFTALEGISINKADFQVLTSSDLAPFASSLIYFAVTHSKLSFLEEKLFETLTALKFVDFAGNPIQYVDPAAFDGPTLAVLRPPSTSCVGFDAIYENAAIIAFIADLPTSTSTCVKPKALQTALRLKILEHLDDIVLKNAAEDKLAQCESDLEGCENTVEPQCPTTPQPDDDDDETTKEPTTDPTETPDEDCAVQLQLQIIETNLYRNYTEVCEAEKAKLEAEIEDLEGELDAYMPSNITCRFKETDDGYTCAGHGLIIKSAGNQKISWTGSHDNGKTNANVESLLIKDQETQFLPSDVGKTFTALTSLIVDASKLQKIGSKDFATLTKLEKVAITGNQIKTIEGKAFDALTNLKSLNLRNNQIGILPAKIFFQLNQLTFLDLGENKINQFRYDLVPAGNKLEEFYADNNPNQYVDIIFIWQMSKAKIIDLRETKCNLFFNVTITPSFKAFFNEIVGKCA